MGNADDLSDTVEVLFVNINPLTLKLLKKRFPTDTEHSYNFTPIQDFRHAETSLNGSQVVVSGIGHREQRAYRFVNEASQQGYKVIVMTGWLGDNNRAYKAGAAGFIEIDPGNATSLGNRTAEAFEQVLATGKTEDRIKYDQQRRDYPDNCKPRN